jgi:hypothetical protein
MIDWNTSNVPPAVDTKDNFNNFHKRSARVLVRVNNKDREFSGCAFAIYHHNGKYWVVEGFMIEDFLGDFEVTHWTSLNEPSTACFSPKNKE